MIEVTGNTRLADIVAISRLKERVSVPEEIRAAVSAAHDRARLLAARIDTYGRTTGVGANRSTEVSDGDTEHGMRLLRSHAVDAGGPLPSGTVRAMLAVRLNQLCVPGSGIDPSVLDGLVAMLNQDALPRVLEYGSIGTGDLSALAGTALTLMGERPASGHIATMGPWGADSALPFISSSALTLGRSCLVVDDIRRLSIASEIIFAMTFIALQGNCSSFSEPAAHASASPRVVNIARTLRELVGRDAVAARIQDPYGLRAFAIAFGPLLESVALLEAQIVRTVNSAQENPLFTERDVVHHAGFYQAALGLDLDAVALSLAQLTPLTMSRIRMMSEPEYSGQAPFLASGPAGSSGTMVIEYVAAAAHGKLHSLAHPSSTMTAVLSRGVEEDASFAPTAVERLESAVPAMKVLLGCELVDAVRLLRMRGIRPDALASDTLRDALKLCAPLSTELVDRDLRPDLEHAQQLVEELGELL